VKTKRLISLAMVLLLCLTIAPIQVSAAPAASSVKLSASSVTLGVGEKKTLTAAVSPSGASQKVSWIAGGSTIAATTAGCTFSAPKAGTYTITAKTGNGKTAKCTVTVKAAPTKVTLNAAKLTLDAGKTYTLKASYAPSGAAGAKSFSSSSAAIASVNSSGKITAKKAGTATITVKTYNGKTAKCTVTVKGTAPTSIKFSAGTANIGLKEVYALSTTIAPAGASGTRTFKSSNAAIASVDASGNVTGKKTGTATITVTTGNGKTATCKVTVKAAPTGVKPNVTSRTIGLGQTYTLKATLAPADAAGKVSYSSSNTAVATVNSAGKITPKKAGSATITLKTYNGKTAKCTVKVAGAPTSVKLPAAAEMGVGQKWKPTATLSPSGSATGYTWSSANTKVATVDSAGNITAKATGSAAITVKTTNGKTAKCTVTVRSAPTGVTVSPTSTTLAVGQSTTLTAKLTASAFSKTAGSVSWKSSNTAVASVDANGKVTGKAAGSATITVTSYNGKTRTCSVKVNTAPTAVKITGTAALYTGQTTTFKAAFTPTDAQGTVAWTSGNTTVAAIDANGKVTAKAAGTAVITATTYNGKKATLTVTVQAAPTSVSLKLSQTELLVGETADAQATILPASVVQTKTFKSSNTAVAAVDANGRITAKSAGTATITVTTVNGKTASAAVTVRPAATGIALKNASFGLGVTKDYPAANITMTPSNAIRRNTFSSSDPSVALVNADGSISALKNGTATITVTTENGKTASATLTVMVPAGKDPLTNAVFPAADIVGYYNYCANATKYTKETVNVSGMHYYKTTASIGTGGIDLGLGDLGSDPSLNNEELVPFGGKGVVVGGNNLGVDFVDGVKFNDTATLAEMLPVNGKPYMSQLKPEHVSSATCTASGGSYKIAITPKNETLTADKPSAIYSSFYLPEYAAEDIGDLAGFEEGDFKVSTPTVAYSGGKIAATANSSNLLNAVRLDAKMAIQISISGSLELVAGSGIKLPISMDMKTTMTFYDDLTFKY